MEVLGTCGTENHKGELRTVERILAGGVSTENLLEDAVAGILGDFLDNPDTDIRITDVAGLVMYLKHENAEVTAPVHRMMLDEAYSRITRHLLMCGTAADRPEDTDETDRKMLMESGEDYFRQDRYLPENGEFSLPEPGSYTNLTVRMPDILMKKNRVREVLIDHNGYVKEEIRSYYEDIYTDESEEIYSEAYLRALREGCGKGEEV